MFARVSEGAADQVIFRREFFVGSQSSELRQRLF